MGIPEKFDVIIIGAGPAGSTAAYKLAEKGYNVLLVEKGRVPGSKNIYGGKVYTYYLKKAYPEIEKEGPIHRWVTKERFSLIVKNDSLTLEYSSPMKSSFTTYLSQLTSWMTRKAENAGAVVVTEITIDKLYIENNEVRGIIAGDERVLGDTVIIAEGANRIVLENSGIVGNPIPNHYALGVKEVIKLDKKRINNRFGVEDKEGVSWIFLGDFLDGLPDGGFLYTFNDTVSLGIIVHIGKARGVIKQHVSRYIENLRLHRLFRKILGDGQLIEYSSHLTIENPLEYAPKKFSGKGYMIIGDAAGFLGNMGYTFRGVDFAAYSGLIAAEAYESNKNDPYYFDNIIRRTPMYKEIIKYRNIHKIMENPRLFKDYTEIINKVFKMKLDIEEKTPTALTVLMQVILDAWLKNSISPKTLINDFLGVMMRI